MKVKVILPYIFQVLYVLCFNRPRYQVSVYRTIGPLVFKSSIEHIQRFNFRGNFVQPFVDLPQTVTFAGNNIIGQVYHKTG